MVRTEEEEQKSSRMYERGFLMLRTVIGKRRGCHRPESHVSPFTVHKS